MTERPAALHGFDDWLSWVRRHPACAFVKINHGFWEALAEAAAAMGWPETEEAREEADRKIGRPRFFAGGFVDELVALLRGMPPGDETFRFGHSLLAFRDSDRISDRPLLDRAGETAERILPPGLARADGLVLKTAVETGEFLRFLVELAEHHVVVVGPELVANFLAFARIGSGAHIGIHPTRARDERHAIERRIAAAVRAGRETGRPITVLLQAGHLTPYLVLRLRAGLGAVRWIDGGQALSLCRPDDIFSRPWGRLYRNEIAATYNRWAGRTVYPERNLLAAVDCSLAAFGLPAAARRREAAPTPLPGGAHGAAAVGPIEEKTPDRAAASWFESLPQRAGAPPVQEALGAALAAYLELPADLALLPCRSGAAALTVLARLHRARAGRLRWVVSALGRADLVRPPFAGSLIVDCDRQGLLSLDALVALDPKSYDGIVVTNPFGLRVGMASYRAFCGEREKVLAADHPGGIALRLDKTVRFQSFSLHHRTPFGFGNGGCVIVPREDAEDAARLIREDGDLDAAPAALLLDRLHRAPEWLPHYAWQAGRVAAAARVSGLEPLTPLGGDEIATALPFVVPADLEPDRLRNPHLALSRIPAPLGSGCCEAARLFRRVVLVPSHPDLRRLDRRTLLNLLGPLGR